jgi:outer membrane protein assembly factor BamD (BamD/ComL family)
MVAVAHDKLDQANYVEAKYIARNILARYGHGAIRESALVILGKALFETQNTDEARIAFEDALRINNNTNSDAHFYLGLIHHNICKRKPTYEYWHRKIYDR